MKPAVGARAPRILVVDDVAQAFMPVWVLGAPPPATPRTTARPGRSAAP
jgi:hypothetical protein